MNFAMKRYKSMGTDIEKAMFSMHQDIGVKYRNWFKAFITALNDEKNVSSIKHYSNQLKMYFYQNF